jgi:hypothetical protein
MFAGLELSLLNIMDGANKAGTKKRRLIKKFLLENILHLHSTGIKHGYI